MKKTTEKTAPARNSPSSGTNKRSLVSDTPDWWIANDRENPKSGFLLFNKLTGTYHAWTSELHIQFPQLARGGFKDPEDCPVDENHLPKADLLMLLALRHTLSSYGHPKWNVSNFADPETDYIDDLAKPLVA